MKPRILVPVNRLAAAKGRLADVLTRDQRAELALATLRTVLSAATAWEAQATVLTADTGVAAHVDRPHVVEEEVAGLAGLSAQIEGAIERLGLGEVLILHADLPLATSAALEALVASAPPPPSATIIESADGGTNAMLLRPPGKFSLHYGRKSASAHHRAAEEAGFAFMVAPGEELALDLDTPVDIARLLGSQKGRTSPAGRMLRSWGF